MIFHENLLADDSHGISYLIFFRKFRKMLQNLSSATAVIGALRVEQQSVSSFSRMSQAPTHTGSPVLVVSSLAMLAACCCRKIVPLPE